MSDDLITINPPEKPFEKQTATLNMADLLPDSPPFILPELGSMVEGRVIAMSKNKILVDLNGIHTGIISGRELKDSQDTVKTLKAEDLITACVVEPEDEEGLIVLSLRKASQAKTWQNFLLAYERKEIIEVKVNEANKGGLLLETDGIKGFIPVSQLTPLHYPRVNGADSGQILERLGKLIGEIFKVKIINIDEENSKLILSEKAAYEEQRRLALQKIKVGQKMKGMISGIVNFGIFVAFEGLEGLVHISEIAWGHVKNPADYGKLGDKVEVLIIGLEKEKISLSMKRLTPDPWIEAAKNFTVGTTVTGEINRITQFGAFMKLADDINGLIHLSELSNKPIKDIKEVIKVGDKVTAKIIVVDLNEHRIGLSIKKSEQSKQTESSSLKATEGRPDKESKKSEQKEKAVEKKVNKTEQTKKPLEDNNFLNNLKLSPKAKKALQAAGYNSQEALKKADKDDLLKIEGVGEKTVEKIWKKREELEAE